MLLLAFAQHGGKGDAADDLERQLCLLRAKRFLKTLAIIQDLADTLLAVNDVRGESAFGTLSVQAEMQAVQESCRHFTLAICSQVAKADYQIRQCWHRRAWSQLHCLPTKTGPDVRSSLL